MTLSGIFGIELLLLLILTFARPMRKWFVSLWSLPHFFIFFLPIVVLLFWPIQAIQLGGAYRDGDSIGLFRYARIGLLLVYVLIATIQLSMQNRISFPRKSPLGVYAVYILVAFCSATYSVDPLQSAWKAFELLAVMMFALSLINGKREPTIQAALIIDSIRFFLFAMCLMSIIGGVLSPDRAWPGEGLAALGVKSMLGIVPSINANSLGQFGAMLSATSLVIYLFSKDRPRFAGALLLGLVGMSAMLLAYSRTSIIAFLLVMAILVFSSRRKWSAALVLVTVIAIAGLLAGDLLKYLQRGQSDAGFATLSGRTVVWELALAEWEKSPLIGLGYSAGHKYIEDAAQIMGGDYFPTLDSTYVETLVNLGVVGFVLLIYFVGYTLVLALRIFRKSLKSDSSLRVMGATLYSYVVIILIRSLTSSSYQVLHINLCILLMVVVALHHIERAQRGHTEGSKLVVVDGKARGSRGS